MPFSIQRAHGALSALEGYEGHQGGCATACRMQGQGIHRLVGLFSAHKSLNQAGHKEGEGDAEGKARENSHG